MNVYSSGINYFIKQGGKNAFENSLSQEYFFFCCLAKMFVEDLLKYVTA